jgi:aryl-alcohol dehydrogenase-like predicted oxidoreductase
VFQRFEKLVEEGLFHAYGVAVWNGFNSQTGELISLEKLLQIAQKVGGENHHFKYIQTPFNIAKTSIYTQETQSVAGESCTLLQAAHRLGIGVISSSSLLQMKLFQKPFSPEVGAILDESMTLQTDIQLALQFVRSTPSLISSLFGSIVPLHVKQNVQISKIKAVSRAKYELLYRL